MLSLRRPPEGQTNQIPIQKRDELYLFLNDHYRFRTPLDWLDFDYRSIDSISHRLEKVPAEKWIRLKKIYLLDKSLFYQELGHYLPPKKVLKYIRKAIAALPLHADRYQLFDEIAALYRSQNWIGMFAVSLSQVEGLFTEMVEILAERSHQLPSLSEKVAYVRRQSQLRISYFDYFQYVVPRLRNKFMHAGYADDYQFRAMDLLYDLHYLLRTFDKLSTSYLVVSSIIRDSRYPYFKQVDDITLFLERLASLNTYQWQKLKEEFYKYEREILSQNSNFLSLVTQIIETLPNLCIKFEDLLNSHKDIQQAGINFINIPLSKKQQLQISEDAYNALQDIADYEIFELRFAAQFIQHFAQFLPSLPKSITDKLSELKRKYKRHLAIYNAIHNS